MNVDDVPDIELPEEDESYRRTMYRVLCDVDGEEEEEEER